MGAWININNGYSPGPRHYCDLPVVRSASASQDTYPHDYYYERAGPTLCGKRLGDSGYIDAGGRDHGGLSAVSTVNLLQSNLCGVCLLAYLKVNPDLAAAVEAAKRIRVDSR